MDGPVCTTVLREDFLGAHPVRFVDDATEPSEPTGRWRSAEDEAAVAAHLRALGYFE